MGNVFILLVIIFFLIIVLAHKLRKFHQQYAVLPGLKMIPSWLWIYSAYVSKDTPLESKITQLSSACCKLFENEELFVFWVAFKPFVIVQKAEAVKMLINHPAMYDKAPEYQLGNFCFGKGLPLCNGDIHRNRKKLLSPAFSAVAVKAFIPIFNEQSVIMVKKLRRSMDDIDEIIDLCMVDIICECAMGYPLETQKGNEDGKAFMDALHRIVSLMTSRMFLPWIYFDSIFWISSIGKKCRRDLEIARGLAKTVIQKKNKNILNASSDVPEKDENDRSTRKEMFIDRLVNLHIKDETFTSETVIDEIMTFLAAGEEASSVTVKNIIFLLGCHPDVQENVIEELDSIFQGDRRDATNEDVTCMKYMECVIKETLRLLPAVPSIARELKEDLEVGKYLLPQGSSIVFLLHQLHRDPKFFPNPEKFDPQRFFPQNSAEIHPLAYLPFSTGVRNCIGQTFAMTEIKILLSHVFRNFRASSIDHRDVINYSWEIVLKPTTRLRIRLTPR